jgi:hypothetical protein
MCHDSCHDLQECVSVFPPHSGECLLMSVSTLEQTSAGLLLVCYGIGRSARGESYASLCYARFWHGFGGDLYFWRTSRSSATVVRGGLAFGIEVNTYSCTPIHVHLTRRPHKTGATRARFHGDVAGSGRRRRVSPHSSAIASARGESYASLCYARLAWFLYIIQCSIA